MAILDIVIIAAYFLLSIVLALAFSKRASKDIGEFFLSGRKLPWWIAGTTMVATTFAADTPLAVTELVAKQGIAGNWLWWNMVAGNILTVFFFARLWRRANIMTDVEFIEIRYAGKPAAFLRGFRAIYLGIFINVVIMGWVNLALASILKVIFNINDDTIFLYIIGAMLITGMYSAISGLWGVAITDVVQFCIAMAGCIVLAVVVLDLPQVGGIAGLQKALPPHVFSFFPRLEFGPGAAVKGVMYLSFSAFIAHIMIQWWAAWYPGSEPGGGGYVAQRIMSAKDERHSLLATLWFTIAHYTLRPWPWIIVALASMVLYPDLANTREGYIYAMKDHLPPGLLGLLVAAFLAAYMSTISSQLNWGCSYIINDFYKRFIKKDASQKHYVWVSRAATILIVFLSALVMKGMNSVSGAWEFIIECGAGLGLVLILRWYWWRINAWSEIAAMIVPLPLLYISRFVLKIAFPESLFFIVGCTTAAWLLITFITKPEPRDFLQGFFERVRPSGPGWRSFQSAAHDDGTESIGFLGINWLLGILLVYATLFGIGKVIFREYLTGAGLLAAALAVFVLLSVRLKSLNSDFPASTERDPAPLAANDEQRAK